MTESDERQWNSRYTYLMALLCQLLNTPLFVGVSNIAVLHGATGYLLCYILCYLVIGIPLLYMEFIICQFTGRDCIDVWKVRPCLAHIGHVQILWQIMTIISNHVNVSFTFHYLLISFESPVPYYTCGPWADKDCDILKHNYTVNEHCIRLKKTPLYCESLHTTFPEYQFWKNNILNTNSGQQFAIAWRVCLASAILTIVVYLNCFKRKSSVKLIVWLYTIYPLLAFMTLLMASMLQKGVVMLYHDALDSDFTRFVKNFRLPMIINQVVNNLGLGSGLMFNLGTGAGFRTPCYSNTVIVVAVCAAASTLSICTIAMMTCPYSYEYGIRPTQIINAHMALIYEKIPRLLREYRYHHFWIVIIFSSLSVLTLSTNVITVHHLVEVLIARSPKIARYPGLTILLILILLYLITIPLLSLYGISITIGWKRFGGFILTYMTILEIIVFVIWYGLDRFSEDVHFMLGIQPRTLMKIVWCGSSVVLMYGFCHELSSKLMDYKRAVTETAGWIIFGVLTFIVFGLLLIKLLIAAYKRQFKEAVRMDQSWGPRDEVLQRSRAMFTAQAMTKEYLYRQYHLQAGIVARQKLSNCRN